jgi:hypothetical protein
VEDSVFHSPNRFENLDEKSRVSGGKSPAIRSFRTGSANAYAVLESGAAVRFGFIA